MNAYYPGAQASQAIGAPDIRGGLVESGFAGQANTLNKPPRLEQNGNRLEHLCEALEKVLGACHVHLDRIAGQQSLERIEKAPGAYANGPSPPAGSTLMRLEQSLDRLAGLSQTLAGGLLERLAGL